MVAVCETCGDVGYEHLLVHCHDCKGAFVHQYCLPEVVFDGSLLGQRLCNECQPRDGEVTYRVSSQKAPNQRQKSKAQPSRSWRNRKSKSCESESTSRKNKYSSRKNSLFTKEMSNLRSVSKNRREQSAESITCSSGKSYHSCETSAMDIAEASNDESQQVDNEHSVHALNNDCIANPYRPRAGQINLQKPSDGYEPPSNKDGDVTENVTGGIISERNKKSLPDRSMATHAPQPFTLQKNAEHVEIENPKGSRVSPVLTGGNQSEALTLQDQAFLEKTSKSTIVLQASATEVELSDAVQHYVEDNPRKPREVILLDEDQEVADVLPEDSNHRSLDYDSKHSMDTEDCVEEPFLTEDLNGQNLKIGSPVKKQRCATEEELSDVVHHYVKENPSKRMQLIILDDDEEEVANELPEDSNHRSLDRDASMCKHRIDTEDCVEEAVVIEDLNGQNLKIGSPVKKQKSVEGGQQAIQPDILIPESCEVTCHVKKRRRYIATDEDEEDGEVTIVTGNAKPALNNAPNLASQSVDAKDYILRSEIAFDSESPSQQCCIRSEPIDEPIWSGTFKIKDGLSVSLAAHLSNKACQRVWELSKTLQRVVEVTKFGRLEAWPKSWNTSGPNDDSIALYFFPPSMGPNEESDSLVEEIIERDGCFKVVVGIAELLIFPSTLLPEQYHKFQGKHYLWGVFKGREVEEQDGSACTAEEGEIQEQFMDQQHELQHKSSEQNRGAQAKAMKAAIVEGLASAGSSSSSSVKLNPAKSGANFSLQPTIGPELHAPEEVNHQENIEDFTKSSCDSGPAAFCPNQSSSNDAMPPTSRLFGFISARTPRAQQLIQEMVSEGALLFSVPEETVTATVGNNTGVGLQPPMEEERQSMEFVPMDIEEASEACLDLFPVRQEQWTPRVEADKDVDLDLNLGTRLRAPSASL